MDTDVRYGPITLSVPREHIFSTDSGVQYGEGSPSVWTRMCSTTQSHHQYGQ